MTRNAEEGEVVFDSDWFQVLEKTVPGWDRPHYAIRSPDFVIVVALNERRQLLLVRQYRPAVGMTTLELPAGHVDAGESPEAAARRELREETGHEAETMELMSILSPSTARFTSRLWCYFAHQLRPLDRVPADPDHGVALVLYDGGVRSLAGERDFFSAANYAALFAAVLRGRLHL
jgi:ADP-ribose pyrophosphatase